MSILPIVLVLFAIMIELISISMYLARIAVALERTPTEEKGGE